MTFKIDKSSGIPVYGQIADWVERRLETGFLKEGDYLPSERKMCEMTGAARNTVKRAYEELLRRGMAGNDKNGRIFVKSRDIKQQEKEAEKMAREFIERLKACGLSWHKTEYLFLEYIWDHLPAAEKLRLLWIDCSDEILKDTAEKIEKSCNVLVTPLLMDDLELNPELLSEGGYDIVATTINHYDEVRQLWEREKGEPPQFEIDTVVLTISRETISRIARLDPDMQVIAVYKSELYRFSLQCYLEEFAVQGKIVYVPLDEAGIYLEQNNSRKAVILPQDLSYQGGEVRRIFEYCMDHNIFCLMFQQIIDNGSLAHLKKRIQQKWSGEEGKKRED